MLRAALIAAVAFAACTSALAQDRSGEEQDALSARVEEEAQSGAIQRDGFVISGDECGASRFSHLLGEQHAELHHATLPANSNVVDRGRLSTLEYTPARLNVVVSGQGRIIAIGCF